MIKNIKLVQELTTPDYRFINLNKDFIPWGIDNLFPEILLDLYQTPTNNLLINLKSNLIVGDGLEFDESNLDLKLFLTNNNIVDLIKKLSLDLVLFGGFCLEIIWSRDFNKISTIKHLPFQKIRIANPTKFTDNSDRFLFNFNWSQTVSRRFKPVSIQSLDPSKKVEEPRQILYYSQYSPGQDYYPVPDYFGSINYISLEKEISIFHINNIKSGFMPSAIIKLPNIPSDGEMEDLERSIREHFSGAQNAGKFLILFGEATATGTQMPEIETFNTTNNVDIYNILNELTTQKILSAHRLSSPVLAGLSGSGNLSGNANEILMASELFQNTVIRTYQNEILNELKKILLLNNLSTDINILNSQPVQFKFSEGLMGNILTINELRNEVGFEEIVGGDEIKMNNEIKKEE